MKGLVYVLVPISVASPGVEEHADELLRPHQMDEGWTRGRYDYLCRLGPVFDDPVTEGRLSSKEKRSLHRHVTVVERLPDGPVPYALVTPDGSWHASQAYIHDYYSDGEWVRPGYHEANAFAAKTWPARYAGLIAQHHYCWVVAVYAHW